MNITLDKENTTIALTDDRGDEINFNAAVALMDDEIRERLHREMAPCTDQEFFDAYLEAHFEMYGEEFRV